MSFNPGKMTNHHEAIKEIIRFKRILRIKEKMKDSICLKIKN